MERRRNNRVEQVRKWLEENVEVLPQPGSVTLSDFFVDWDTFSGEFRVSLGSVPFPRKLPFSLDVCGRTQFHLPMFHSPLGAPASYAAIHLTPATEMAILNGLHQTIPRIKAAGLDKETGKHIAAYTPPVERIDAVVLEQLKSRVSKDYSITVTIDDVND